MNAFCRRTLLLVFTLLAPLGVLRSLVSTRTAKAALDW